MRLILDTQLLIWTSVKGRRLSATARELIENEGHDLVFSVASIWETAIKFSLGRDDFDVDPRLLRRGLIENGYEELSITGEHAAAVSNLPALHRDPFDRLLVAQAMVEGAILVTADAGLSVYPGPIRKV